MDPLSKYFPVEPSFQQGEPPIMDIPNYGGVFYDDQTGQTIPMGPEEQAYLEEMKVTPMGNLTPEQLMFAEQIRKRGMPVEPQQAPEQNPLEPYLVKTQQVKNSQQMLPVSDDQIIRDLMQQYGDQAKEAINLQKSGISSLEQNILDLKRQERQYDLSPLAGLVDTWTGSELGKYYKRPETAQERSARVLDLEMKLQNARQGLSKEQRELMGEQLNAYLKSRKDPLTQAVKEAQIQWYKANAGKPAQQQTKEAQNLKEDVLKTKESQNVQALIKLQGALDEYESLVKEHGVEISGANRKKIEAAFANLKIKYKEAANLGALTGPDISIIEEGIAPATGVSGAAKGVMTGGKEGILKGLQQVRTNIESDADVPLNALESTFPAETPTIKEYRQKLYRGRELQQKRKRLEELRRKQGE